MKNLLNKLKKLAQLEVNTANAYESAIIRIADQSVISHFKQFKSDHERHIKDLNKEILNLKGQLIEKNPGLKGLLIKGLTALRSMTGTMGALKAMQGNEYSTNKTYEDTLNNEMPPHIRDLLRKNIEDKHRHLRFIEEKLSEINV